jgi:hypothetical protein
MQTLPKIDVPRLRQAMSAAAEAIRALKKVLRSPWPAGQEMAQTQWELLKLQHRATELCILRARLRGRYHLKVAPRPIRDAGLAWDQERHHAQVADRLAAEFGVQEAPVAMTG